MAKRTFNSDVAISRNTRSEFAALAMLADPTNLSASLLPSDPMHLLFCIVEPDPMRRTLLAMQEYAEAFYAEPVKVVSVACQFEGLE